MTWTILGGALLAAGLPTFAYLGLVWWLDRYEKEPLHLLLVSFLWGALPAAVLVVVLEVALEVPLASLGDPQAEWRRLGLIGPIIEELVKGAAVIGLYRWRRAEFNGILDGIIYGAFVGLGFALTENFLIFLATFSQQGLGLGLVIVSLRAVVFGLNHPLFTAIYGAGLGWARYQRSGLARLVVPAVCLLAATGLHLLHNALTSSQIAAEWGVILALVADWSGLGLIMALVVLAWVHERHWIVVGLRDEVHLGHVTDDEYRLVASHRRRAAAEWRAFRRAGWPTYRAVTNHFQALTKLAFARYHRQSGAIFDPEPLRATVRAGRLEIARSQRPGSLTWSLASDEATANDGESRAS